MLFLLAFYYILLSLAKHSFKKLRIDRVLCVIAVVVLGFFFWWVGGGGGCLLLLLWVFFMIDQS